MPSFPKQQAPTDIGRVVVSFATSTEADTEINAASVEFEIIDAAGVVVSTRSHGLLPYMTETQKTAIFNFINAIRTKAKAEAV